MSLIRLSMLVLVPSDQLRFRAFFSHATPAVRSPAATQRNVARDRFPALDQDRRGFTNRRTSFGSNTDWRECSGKVCARKPKSSSLESDWFARRRELAEFL